MLARCNNQPNRQMGYVGEMQQSVGKMQQSVGKMQQSTSKQINNNSKLTCYCDTPNTKLKTLAILAVCLYPPVGICNVLKWEMGLPQGL